MFVGQSSFLLEIVSKMMYITMHAAIIPSNFTTMASNQSVVFKCCSVFTVNETLVANCSNLNWTFVHLRCVPVTTEVLLLDRNNLTTLTNGSFQALTSLRQLSLQTSNIHRIEIDTFLGLSLLQTLNLENNKLSDIGNSFNPQTFRHLRNLRQLFIGNNQNFSKSLGKAFIYLHNLSLLSMDSSATLHVGSEFSNLTQLNNLTLNCSIVTSITNESFVGLWSSKLTILNLISFNKLKYDPDDFDKVTSQKQFSDDAFQNLNSLEVLRIIKCRIGNKNMARKIKHFINSSLHTLYLEATHYKRGFYTPNSTLEDGVIFKSTAKYLSQLTLTHVSWIDSNIFAIEPGVISSPQWRHNLRIADFSKNQMGWLGWRSPLLEASRLEKLEELTITAPSPESEVSYFYDGLDFYKRNVQPTGTTQTMKTYDSKDNNSRNNALFINATVSQMSAKKNNDSEKIKFFNKEENLALEPIALSPNTSYVELDSISEQSLFQLSDNPPYPIDSGTWTVRMSHSLRIIKIMYLLHGDNNVGNQSVQFIQTPREAANVTHFYFVGNSVFRGTGRMMGLTNLQLFDLSKNSLSVAPYFFDDFPSLKYLILQSTKNENFFQHISIDRIIQNMPELRYLDLTDNKLNFLPPNLFSRNSHITHVILAKNRFSSFPITMDLVPNLKTLDLTGNAIIYLTEEEMTFLTKHSENVPDFSLLLAENNIACVCSQIKFLLWLNISNFLDNKGAYSCTSQDGQLIFTNVLSQDVLGFYRQCYGYDNFMISIVLLLVMSFTFLVAYLVHRFRTVIEAYLVRIFIKAFRPMKSSDYKTHVFIGYADEDVGFVRYILLSYLEEDLKVSTFVHHRDLGPGYTDQQMFESMSDSWRILLVITQRFLNNYDLSDIIMKYASHSMNPANEKRVVLLVQQTQLYNIPGYLYDVLEDSRIIVISDLSAPLDYVKRQAIKQCLRDIQ